MFVSEIRVCRNRDMQRNPFFSKNANARNAGRAVFNEKICMTRLSREALCRWLTDLYNV
jgi:hypothetical protein